jgi:hypothetical protein
MGRRDPQVPRRRAQGVPHRSHQPLIPTH